MLQKFKFTTSSLSLFHSISFLLVPIRGADIIATTTLEVIPGTPLTYLWEDHGLKLHIPADALKPGSPSQIMTIQASLSGQYQLPDGTELVSGVYWVVFPQRFLKPVTLELQHRAYLEHSDQPYSLSFVSAKCNQETLPYHFESLPDGVFSSGNCYGSIKLSHFSGVGIVGEMGNRKYYAAQTFYIPQAISTIWLMDFALFGDLELYIRVRTLHVCLA